MWRVHRMPERRAARACSSPTDPGPPETATTIRSRGARRRLSRIARRTCSMRELLMEALHRGPQDPANVSPPLAPISYPDGLSGPRIVHAAHHVDGRDPNLRAAIVQRVEEGWEDIRIAASEELESEDRAPADLRRPVRAQPFEQE